jgi:hypothetical protein
MFIEELERVDNQFKVTVSIKKRKFAIEDKLIYSGDPKSLVPEEFRDKVELVSTPDKKVSNMGKDKYTQSGTWVFQLKEPEPAKKPTRRRRVTKPKEETQQTEEKTSTKKPIRSRIKKVVENLENQKEE